MVVHIFDHQQTGFPAVQAGNQFPAAVPETLIPAGTVIPFGAINKFSGYIVALFAPTTSPVMIYRTEVPGSGVKNGSFTGSRIISQYSF